MKPELWPEFLFHISIVRPQTEYPLWVRTKSIFTFTSTPSEATECPAPHTHTAPPHLRSGSCTAFPTWRHQLLSPLSTSLPLIASLSSTHTSLRPSLPLVVICDCFQNLHSEAYHGIYQFGSSPTFRDSHAKALS